MLREHFGFFFDANPGWLHFAAHSHHLWPDATRAAQDRYWTDSASLTDRKWAQRVFAEVVPEARGHVARLLHLPDPAQVAFAHNTHEFVNRLYSCLEGPGPFKVLTTAHEFYSFRRQTRRLREGGRLVVEEIAGEPWDTFVERFVAAERGGDWDMVWLSHVFFDSGFAVPELRPIVAAAPAKAIVAIDGYHAFCALPVDLSGIHERAFYLGGGYKYAMAGEGAAYLVVPPRCALRPANTGWFASFDSLSEASWDQVSYAEDAFRFWGATFDPTGLYRFNAAMAWLRSTGVTIEEIHRHSLAMQKRFLDGLARAGVRRLAPDFLVPPMEVARGNFLTFDVDDAAAIYRAITEARIVIDRRDRRLRFGFGAYHDAAQVEELVDRLSRVLR